MATNSCKICGYYRDRADRAPCPSPEMRKNGEVCANYQEEVGTITWFLITNKKDISVDAKILLTDGEHMSYMLGCKTKSQRNLRLKGMTHYAFINPPDTEDQ